MDVQLARLARKTDKPVVPINMFRCTNCGWMKKLQSWLVPRELLCTTCGRRCTPKIQRFDD